MVCSYYCHLVSYYLSRWWWFRVPSSPVPSSPAARFSLLASLHLAMLYFARLGCSALHSTMLSSLPCSGLRCSALGLAALGCARCAVLYWATPRCIITSFMQFEVLRTVYSMEFCFAHICVRREHGMGDTKPNPLMAEGR